MNSRSKTSMGSSSSAGAGTTHHHESGTASSSSSSSTSASTASSRPTTSQRRRIFTVGNFRFTLPKNWFDFLMEKLSLLVELFILYLGPFLIIAALSILSLLTYTFYTTMVPMMLLKHENSPWKMLILGTHCTIVVFFVVEILFNYYHCVMTTNNGKNYDRLVRELAQATNFVYPETPAQVAQYRREYEDRMRIRMRQRQLQTARQQQNAVVNRMNAMTADAAAIPPFSTANGNNVTQRRTNASTAASSSSSSTTATGTATSGGVGTMPIPSTPTQTPASTATTTAASNSTTTNQPKVRAWMIMDPMEWGWCSNTKQPKPPRSHYDHVTRKLVLNLDHFCPWMFNAVGYFNYRYFVNFLVFCCFGMMYAVILAWEPFMLVGGTEYRNMIRIERRTGSRPARTSPMVPYHDEKTMITLCFMLSLAVGLAVMGLGGFHIYLTLTAQTTIEYHGNWTSRYRYKKMGMKWKNPYSIGMKGNWQQVYGKKYSWFFAIIIPSTREPDVLPIPIPGHPGRGVHADTTSSDKTLIKDIKGTNAALVMNV